MRRRAYVVLAILIGLVGLAAVFRLGDGSQHYRLGQDYERRGMEAHAIREYRSVLERQADHEGALLRLARLYDDQDQVDAIEMYRRFLARQPDSLSVGLRLARTYARRQRYDEAIAVFEDLADRRPQWPDLWAQLGYAYEMAGRPLPATEAYGRALTMAPDSSSVRYRLASLHQGLGNTQAAIREWKTLAEEFPREPELRTRMANSLIGLEEGDGETVRLGRTERTDLAEKHLRAAVEHSPHDLGARWSLALLLMRQGRYVPAIEHLRRILEMTPEDPYVHQALANVYQRTGNVRAARRHVAEFARTDRTQRIHAVAQTELQKQIEGVLKR